MHTEVLEVDDHHSVDNDDPEQDNAPNAVQLNWFRMMRNETEYVFPGVDQ